MPSLTQTMGAPAFNTIFSLGRGNAKIKPSLIMVNNVLGAQDAIITVIDTFVPSASNGTPVPIPMLIPRLGINVSMAACVSMRDELKDVMILGVLSLVIGVADANCIVTVAWSFV